MCKKCGYAGDRLIYSFTDYGYIVASNDDDPEIIGPPPEWITIRGTYEIGYPVGCPECHNWGIDGFGLTEEVSAMIAEAEISRAKMVDEEFDVAEPQVLQIEREEPRNTRKEEEQIGEKEYDKGEEV